MSNFALGSSIGPFYTTFWSKEDESTKDKPFEGQYVVQTSQLLKNRKNWEDTYFGCQLPAATAGTWHMK